MPKLNHRQNLILNYIRHNPGCQSGDIVEFFKKTGASDISRITAIRDLNRLIKDKLIKKSGQGRSVIYRENISNPFFSFFDADDYFKLSTDERKDIKTRFDFSVFEHLNGLFSREELSEAEKINAAYQRRINKLPADAIQREWERLTIELAWKSSRIEGNTYSLIDTEILIKEHQEAKGHKKDESVMILNHKTALDWIFKNQKKFKIISINQIESLHELLVKGLNINTGIRKGLVGIVGTNFRPLDNQHQIREAMEKTVKLITAVKQPLEKALIAALLLAYIQPFYDGNKRTSRILANAILMAHDYCPLSFRSVNEADYKKAVILFYEQNSIIMFKKLFFEQFKFSINNYFK